RVVQEALTNIATHARATHVDIRLLQTPRTFLCSIADDGVGLEAVARPRSGGERGFGLAGARDQVAALGGTMSINSARGTGLELAIMIPLDEKRAAEGFHRRRSSERWSRGQGPAPARRAARLGGRRGKAPG